MSKRTLSVFFASILTAASLTAATDADIPLGYCDNLKGWATVSWATPAKAGLEPPKVSLSSEQTRESRPSLKVEYAYKAEGAMVDNVVENYSEMPGRPAKFSVWVYGDGSGHQLDFIITDKNGQAFCITTRLDWKGEWKKLDFDFEGSKTCWGGSGGEKGKIAYPIKHCSFDIIKGAQQPDGEGVVYLSDLRITADAGPEVTAEGVNPIHAVACHRTSQETKIGGLR